MRLILLAILIVGISVFLYLDRDRWTSVGTSVRPDRNSARDSESRVGTAEDWDADRSRMHSIDVVFTEDRSKLVAYSAQPELSHYQGDISALIGIADQLHEHAHTGSAEALQHGDSNQFLGYSNDDSAGAGSLDNVVQAIEYPNLYSAEGARNQIEGAQDSVAPEVLAEYARDTASVRKYGQEPTSLAALETDASARIAKARSLLENGDLLGAHVAAATANAENHYVVDLLSNYFQQVYIPNFADNPRRAEKN
jgi:hypothetical protein